MAGSWRGGDENDPAPRARALRTRYHPATTRLSRRLFVTRRIVIGFFAGVGAALLGIQLVPVDCTNPPVLSSFPASAQAQAILRRACYDCHSNETTWPWYSRVAPVSWFIARHVRQGRAKLNYSTWDQYAAADKAKKLAKTAKELQKGKMPLRSYVLLHRNAALSAQDVALLSAEFPAVARPVVPPSR